jgi:perosamine synthetase
VIDLKNKDILDKMILTAGPSITSREIDYVTDAITNGHDEHWGDYIMKFERAFARYLGVKCAMTTSSCTGAMHLALRSLGIKEGDEVIVPDMSWVATASVVTYVGAEPVFADVLKDSWTISPESIRERITGKTKAIIPVHLYGHPCDMIEIIHIARNYDLKILEDSAPALGAEYDKRKTGTFGDFAAFSFQGAKLLSTGEGGMLVTDNTVLYEKAMHFANHGRVSQGFEINDIGYKYKMSNLQAAWGLAQLERINELIEKRVQIYEWYRNELKDTEGLQLNKLSSYMESPIYWMTSIILNKDFGVTRDELMVELKKRNIDTRPFFPQMSSFPMFKSYDNPVANYLGKNGINLPSAHKRTREDIIYICNCVKEILGV